MVPQGISQEENSGFGKAMSLEKCLAEVGLFSVMCLCSAGSITSCPSLKLRK